MEKTGRAIIIQLLFWGIAIPIIFPMTALLTRYLGPVRYGEYSFTLSFLAVFALFSGTGMDPLIIRQLSRQLRRGHKAAIYHPEHRCSRLADTDATSKRRAAEPAPTGECLAALQLLVQRLAHDLLTWLPG
jgi:hypothetical protein